MSSPRFVVAYVRKLAPTSKRRLAVEPAYIVEGACICTRIVLGKEASNGGVVEVRGRISPNDGASRFTHDDQTHGQEHEQSWTGAHIVRMLLMESPGVGINTREAGRDRTSILLYDAEVFW